MSAATGHDVDAGVPSADVDVEQRDDVVNRRAAFLLTQVLVEFGELPKSELDQYEDLRRETIAPATSR